MMEIIGYILFAILVFLIGTALVALGILSLLNRKKKVKQSGGDTSSGPSPKTVSSGTGKGWWWKLLLILFLLPSIFGLAANIFLGFKQVPVTRYLVPIHEVECPMSAAIPGETYQYTLRRWETKEFRIPVGYLQCHDSPIPLEVTDTWNGQRQTVRWD